MKRYRLDPLEKYKMFFFTANVKYRLMQGGKKRPHRFLLRTVILSEFIAVSAIYISSWRFPCSKRTFHLEVCGLLNFIEKS